MQNLTSILPSIPGFILGLTLHEFSHAYVANRLGDPTARNLGRLTLNPLAHLDVMGSLMLVVVGFGWAKPVPYDPQYLRSPKRDAALIAVAGPLSNLIIALAVSLLFMALVLVVRAASAAGALGASGADGIWGSVLGSNLRLVLDKTIQINIILAVLNLLPIPPLDGSQILAGIVPESLNHGYEQFRRIGPMLLIGIVAMDLLFHVSVLWTIMTPPVQFLYNLVMLPWRFL